MYATHRHDLFYLTVKYNKNVLNCFQVIERTRNGRTDARLIAISPEPFGRGIKAHAYLQTIVKAPVKFQTDRPKTVGGVPPCFFEMAGDKKDSFNNLFFSNSLRQALQAHNVESVRVLNQRLKTLIQRCVRYDVASGYFLVAGLN